MHLTTALHELSEAELLDHADAVSRMQRECDAQVLRIAVQQAILHAPETVGTQRIPVDDGLSPAERHLSRALLELVA